MIDLADISLQFDGKYLFRNVNLKINSGDKAALVGANGSGKSSLLKILYGELLPETGSIQKQNRISVGYLPQDNIIHTGSSLLDEAMSALTDITNLKQKEEELTAALSSDEISNEEQEDLVNNLGEVHRRLEELDSYSASSRVEKILMGLGFEEKDFSRVTDEFSGGWQMRIALAKILISQNDIILLDEPTNHLDLDSLEWLVDFLNKYKGALIIVSHDKHFINSVTNKTYEIFNKRFSIFNGKFNSYIKFKEERDKELIHKHELQKKKLEKTKRFIEQFRYKNTKAKQVQSRIKQLEKEEIVELPDFEDEININFPKLSKSGKINVELHGVSKSYGSNKIFDEIDFKIVRGEKIAFVGPNGAGKTTLAKILAGIIDFDNGERIRGHNTFISFYAQDVADNLSPDLDILETVYGIAKDKTPGELRSLLGAFLFSGDDVYKKISVLSGGEKSRVALAKILLTKSNLVILDEPTNHLDISSKKVLQTALINFPGSLILVSHDVDFLQPVVNKVVEIRKGHIKTFVGGIDYYLEKREEIRKNESEHKSAQTEKVNSKKDQKRIEAEKRQAKYQAIKGIVDKIVKLEKEIENLEKKEKQLEGILADSKTYDDREKAKEMSNDFLRTKQKLNDSITKWEKLNIELKDIESQFD